MSLKRKKSNKEELEHKQILKTRDDKKPVVLVPKVDPEGGHVFSLDSESQSSWIKSNEGITEQVLRSRIEPWLTALFQTDHLSLLVGSGLSHAVHGLATGMNLPSMDKTIFSKYHDDISEEVQRTAKLLNRGEGNLEDQIRVANELARGLDILSKSNENAKEGSRSIREDLKAALNSLATSVLKTEAGLACAPTEKQEFAFNYLVSFLMSFASRSGTRDRLHIFSTNYDRILEAGADIAGLHLIDRFIGSLAPLFRSSRLEVDLHYNPPGIRGEPRYLEGVARFTKLHGSLDWLNAGGNIQRIGLPFGAKTLEPYLKAIGSNDASPAQIMVYPNSAKDRETAAYPYVELFRDLAASICRPNSALVTYGYSFGDEHINRVIEDMLTIPSSHLVVISYGDPLGRIMKTYEKLGRHAQMTILIGDHLGDFLTLVDNYLPKPAIDRTSFRMAEILKSRWSSNGKLTQKEVEDKAAFGEGESL